VVLAGDRDLCTAAFGWVFAVPQLLARLSGAPSAIAGPGPLTPEAIVTSRFTGERDVTAVVGSGHPFRRALSLSLL
jgi:hypothetical protein